MHKLVKFVAKLRLIEHGLLVAAQGLDDTQLKGGKGKGSDDEEEEVESLGEFEARINGYVEGHLKRASTSKRDNYKDGLVYQARKDVINDFLKIALARKKCLNCDALVFFLHLPRVLLTQTYQLCIYLQKGRPHQNHPLRPISKAKERTSNCRAQAP